MTKHQKYSLGLKLEAVRRVQASESPKWPFAWHKDQKFCQGLGQVS